MVASFVIAVCLLTIQCTGAFPGALPRSLSPQITRQRSYRPTVSRSLAALHMTALIPEGLEEENRRLQSRVDELEELLGRTEGLCEVLEGDASFVASLRSRASWLLGLLLCQSASSFILEGNEALIQSHPVIVYFMTMLVGAGGNAGNQASVRIIRGLATGEVNPMSERSFGAPVYAMRLQGRGKDGAPAPPVLDPPTHACAPPSPRTLMAVPYTLVPDASPCATPQSPQRFEWL